MSSAVHRPGGLWVGWDDAAGVKDAVGAGCASEPLSVVVSSASTGDLVGLASGVLHL